MLRFLNDMKGETAIREFDIYILNSETSCVISDEACGAKPWCVCFVRPNLGSYSTRPSNINTPWPETSDQFTNLNQRAWGNSKV